LVIVIVAVDRLVSLVPPPASPVDADGDWRRVQRLLGVALPGEFRVLLGRYGVGSFDDITLLTPFDTHPQGVFDLVEHAERLIPWFEDLREDSPADFPFPLYPEPGGLLPWATTSVGTDLCWLTEGRPDRWPTAVWNVRGGGSRYDLGAVDLLHDYLSGRLRIERLGPPPAVPWFDPYRQRREVRLSVAGSDLPYAERVRTLRDHLAPTADRGSSVDSLGRRQDRFKAVERDWLLTYYELGYQPDGITIAFPPEDDDDARNLIVTAVQAMGSRVLHVHASGHAEPVWGYDARS
jgi:hypothetical protein